MVPCTKCGKPVSELNNYQYGFRNGKSFTVVLCQDCSSNMSEKDISDFIDDLVKKKKEEN